MFIQTLWMQLFIFILLCAILTIRTPPWFGWKADLNTLWYWIVIVVVALTTIIQECKN
ncbi:hypothetical protein RHGRI_020881 [Rhododendron griersonianum]|uniref:Uncharacterized protein n=1 Tax=Rhododendron griersonianum TaxID=479676 RepID=A0AAV6JN89_9ERIC|nr:hypothetical protein RHGRI_020881 [Rhododendron griersonianum]